MQDPPYDYLFLLCKTPVASLSDSKLVDLAKRICSSKSDLSLCCLPITTVLTPHGRRGVIIVRMGGTQQQQWSTHGTSKQWVWSNGKQPRSQCKLPHLRYKQRLSAVLCAQVWRGLKALISS